MDCITYERAHELFYYSDGILYRKTKVQGGRTDGLAGCLDKRVGRTEYMRIRIDGKSYLVHHIIWLMFNGKLPEYLDHIDGNGLNNKIENLREVSHKENMMNKKKYRNNTSGLVGVSWAAKAEKWYAYIQHNKKRISLGHFDNILDAAAARISAQAVYNYHRNHGRVDE